MKIFNLHADWWLKLVSTPINSQAKNHFRDKIPAQVLGSIYTDLLRAGIIPDPFYGDNEKRLGWISESDWLYSTQFNLPPDMISNKDLYLVCEGLDTISQVYLNGVLLGHTENMFRCYQFPIGKLLTEKNNELEVHFTSPQKYGRQMETKYGKKKVALASERVYVRKAQYSFGWDWGPAFPTMGIWKSIYIRDPEIAYIDNVRFHTPYISKRKAEVMIDLEIAGRQNDYFFSIEMKDEYQTLKINSDIFKSKRKEIKFSLPNPILWWPNGEGEPHLYDLKISLITRQGQIIDQKSLIVGIRSVTLQLKDKSKALFRFLVNGRPVYMKGANWIPADSFLERTEYDNYKKLIQLAKGAQMNMLRVWGGGIYENDSFYSLCDALGILVWQDFMFACGHYPTHSEFIENIKVEFNQNINRLQYHPSIVLWCGNNEIEWGWSVHEPEPLQKMPDYKIYHKILPNLIKRLDPLRPYWPSSPFGMDGDPNSAESGNHHQWDIWSGWEDYTEVDKDNSLFVSEFGFQGPANRKTLEKVIPDADRHPQSQLVEFHNKQVEGTERIFRFLAGHLPILNNWADFIYLAQLNQGLALKYCIEHWRLRWPETAGSIIWQLNDCWPVISWSLIDFDLKPKMAYHFVHEAFNPFLIGFKKNNNKLDIVGLNSTPKEFNGKLRICFWDAGTWQKLKTEELPVNMKRNGVRKIFSTPLFRQAEAKNWIIVTTLLDENDRRIHRNMYLQTKWKHLNLPKADVSMTLKNDPEGKICCLATDFPAFFVDLYHPDCGFTRRGFMILPDETLEIQVTGDSEKDFKLNEVQVFMLNKYSKA